MVPLSYRGDRLVQFNKYTYTDTYILKGTEVRINRQYSPKSSTHCFVSRKPYLKVRKADFYFQIYLFDVIEIGAQFPNSQFLRIGRVLRGSDLKDGHPISLDINLSLF